MRIYHKFSLTNVRRKNMIATFAINDKIALQFFVNLQQIFVLVHWVSLGLLIGFIHLMCLIYSSL